MTDSLKHKWWEFHKENPHVYDLFQNFTLDVIARGHKHYSAKAVFERIRWHTDVETKCEREFKLSNNHTAYYARFFHHCYPQHNGFFRTKETRS